MAVGISCAGTGRRDAQLLIEPLLTDAVDFVRQGAFVATALVMLQQPESQVRCCPLLMQAGVGFAVEPLLRWVQTNCMPCCSQHETSGAVQAQHEACQRWLAMGRSTYPGIGVRA